MKHSTAENRRKRSILQNVLDAVIVIIAAGILIFILAVQFSVVVQ